MIGVVLAAGRGSRLGAASGGVPKPMVDIAGVPALGRILASMADGGISEAVVVVGVRGDAIVDHLASPLPVTFVRQAVADGTATAALMAEPLIGDRSFVLGWGDVLVDPATYRLLGLRLPDADAVVAVNRVADPSAGALVSIGPGWQVTGIVEKPGPGAGPGWNNAGVMGFTAAVWEALRGVARSVRGEFEVSDAIAALAASGRVAAVPVAGRWHEIGTPEGLAAARAAYSS